MASILEIQRMLQNFTQDRPTMQENNTKERLIQLLANEVKEAQESLHDPVELPRELADVVILALSIANLFELDMDLEVRDKVAYNLTRYSSSLFQGGSYEESRLKVKEFEKTWHDQYYVAEAARTDNKQSY